MKNSEKLALKKSKIELVDEDVNRQVPSTGKLQCPKCNRILKTETYFLKHQQMHERKDCRKQKLTYTCKICKKVLFSSSGLQFHERKHRGERPFLCSVCGKSFFLKGDLTQHSKRHLQEKQHRCPYCPKSFSSRNSFNCHLLSHNAKPKNHICDVCGRGFHIPSLLKQHKRYHSNERLYPCDQCDKRFFTKSCVKKHALVHTGEKPYKCHYCAKSYARSCGLMGHLRTHLGDNIYQCEFCPQKFPSAKLLREHFSAHNNDDEETKARHLAALNALEIKGVYMKANGPKALSCSKNV